MKDPIRAKRAVIAVSEGRSVKLRILDDNPDDVIAEVGRFAKLKKIPVATTLDGEFIALSPGDPDAFKTKRRYGEIDDLAPGQSVTLDVVPAQYMSVRQAAGRRNSEGKKFFTCSIDGDKGMRVTRQPLRVNVLSEGIPPLAVKASKYGLERLASESDIRVVVSARDEASLRVAASARAKREGWRVHCRLVEPGLMRIYRTDGLAALAPDEYE